MRFRLFILSAAAWAWPAIAAQTSAAPGGGIARALPLIAKWASQFWHSAPDFMGRETLKQKTVSLPKPRLRIGRRALERPKPVLKEREIVSYYAFSSYKTSPEALHEFRHILTIDGETTDGKKTPGADRSRENFRATLESKGDRDKKALRDDFEEANLAVAATDFGQLVLLFTRANLDKYTFEPPTTGMVGADRAMVIDFHQSAGGESLRISESGKRVKEPLSGQLWVRESDYQPLRITLRATRRDLSDEIRDEARVDYAPQADGMILPASVVHRRFVNNELSVENVYEYSDWRPVHPK